MATICVREVDKVVFKNFKAKAVQNGLNIGDALTLAMHEWVDFKRVSFLKLKPVKWGKGTERVSEEIDRYVYGGRS
jgi:hypothetical protein